MNIYDYPTMIQSSIQLLEEGLKNTAWPIRFACAEAWSDLNKNHGLQELLEGFKHNDASVRDRAIQAMGKLKDKNLLPHFQKALEDQDLLVQVHALEAIAMVLSEKSLHQIQNSLKGKHSLVQECAVRCLENFIPKELAYPLLKQILEQNEAYYYTVPLSAAYFLAKNGEKAGKDFLYKMLENQDSWIAFTSAQKLAKLKDATGIDCIKQMLQWGSWKHKILALSSLIDLGEKKDVATQLYCPGEVPDKATRLEIIRLLDNFAPENTGKLLEEAFSTKEEETCIRVLELLGEIKRPDLLYIADDIIQKGPEYLRATLIKSIEKINNRNVLPYLFPILTKAHWLVRIQAARVLLKLAL